MQALMAAANFLGARCDARALGLCCVAVGAAAFLRGLVSYHLLDRLLVEGTVRARMFPWLPAIDRDWIAYFIGFWLLCSVFFTVGLFTRTSGALLAACIAYHLVADQNLFWSHIYYLFLLILLLTIANSGAVFSLDWVRRGKPAATVPRWPVTLLKLQVSALYFFTAIAKINPYFMSGEVLGESFRIPDSIETPLLLQTLAVATIGLELFVAVGLWSRKLQRAAFLAGLVFHTLVLVLIGFYGGLVVFGVTILAPYLLFLRHEAGTRLVAWSKGHPHPGRIAGWVRRLDWLGVHKFEETQEHLASGLELHADGRVLHGFDALREILAVLPLTFLWAPALGLPGVRSVGRMGYRLAVERPDQASATGASG